jgi:F0F1-type ATP synthase epsilon subunit
LRLFIRGGFAEVDAEVVVLAEETIPLDEFDVSLSMPGSEHRRFGSRQVRCRTRAYRRTLDHLKELRAVL